MKRLLLFVDLFPRVPVGGTLWLSGLAPKMREAGMELHVVLSGPPYEQFASDFAAGGGKLHVEPLMRGKYDVAAGRRIMENVRPDGVCFMFYPMLSMPVLKAARFPTVRAAFYIDQSSKALPLRKGLKKLFLDLRGRFLGPCYAAIVSVSDFKSGRLRERLGLPPERIHRIYNGVLTQRYDQPPERIAEDAPLLYAGQIAGYKGVPALLRAYRRYLERHPDAPELHLAGDGPAKAELEEQTRTWDKAGKVKFLGMRNDIAGLMMAARLILIPSEWDEACAFVAIEAMFARRPVLASDAGSLAELLGEHGLIHRAGDVDDLERALEQALQPERREELEARGLALRKRAEGLFTLDKMVAGYVDLFGKFLL